MIKIISAAALCLLLVSCGPPQNGHGTIELDDGTKYVGEFKDGQLHGQGTLTFPNEIAKHVGEFKDGEPHGQGTLTSADGEKYVGEWKYAAFHGQGTRTWASGDK